MVELASKSGFQALPVFPLSLSGQNELFVLSNDDAHRCGGLGVDEPQNVCPTKALRLPPATPVLYEVEGRYRHVNDRKRDL